MIKVGLTCTNRPISYRAMRLRTNSQPPEFCCGSEDSKWRISTDSHAHNVVRRRA